MVSFCVAMADTGAVDYLIVQLHVEELTPVGGGSTHIIQSVHKIDRSFLFRDVLNALDMCAPYDLVAVDLLDSMNASTPFNVGEFEGWPADFSCPSP